MYRASPHTRLTPHPTSGEGSCLPCAILGIVTELPLRARPALTFCSCYFELKATFAKLASRVICLAWLWKKAELFSKSPSRGWGVEGRLGIAGKNSDRSTSVESGWGRGFGGRGTPPSEKRGRGVDPVWPEGQVLDSIWGAETQPVLALEVEGGCDLWEHGLFETN